MSEQPDPRRYLQAKNILQQALDLAPLERSAFIDAACRGDESLRADVLSLLAAHNEANSSFLESPVDGPIVGQEPEPDVEELNLTGQRVGAYRVEQLLGRGGMGAVYLASRDDGEFTKHVAIKFIRPSIVSPSLLKRFKAERQILANIEHAHIARLIDGGTADGNVPFFIMEYVPGETLAQALTRGPLPVARATRVATEVADVLSAVHSRGLVFRDLKPSNIMLTTDGGAKVLDFGIAKIMSGDSSATTALTLTEPGRIIGTLRYMSPEQAVGERVDARSDVFAFGVVMFEVLTGRLPFAGETKRDYMKALIAGDAAALPATVPANLRTIVERCLRNNPAERYASGKELAEALRSAAVVKGVNKRDLWSIVGIAAAVAIGFGIWLVSRPKPDDAVGFKAPAQFIVSWPSDERNPKISPDLRWVSFISDRDGDKKIWMIDRKTSEERSLPSVGGELTGHAWSPAADRIACFSPLVDRTSLSIIPIGGGAMRTFELAQPDAVLTRWIGDGIYYLSKGSLWRFDIVAERSREVTTARGTLDFQSADVSADERQIVFTAIKDSVSSIWISGMDGSSPTRLTEERIGPRFLRWKSRAAREVVYVSTEDGMYDIWLLDVATRKRHRLTATEAREGALDAGGDGELLVYERIREEAHLAMLDPAERNAVPKPLTSDSLSDLMPDVSTTGHEVVFQRSPMFDLSRGVRKNTGIQLNRDDFRGPSEKLADGYAPDISPDGRWVAYFVWALDKDPELWVFDIQNRRPTMVSGTIQPFSYTAFPLTVIGANLAWSPQGSHLFFVARESPTRWQVWDADVSGTAVHSAPLTKIDEQDATITDLQVSRDGSQVSYVLQSRARAVSELHVVDLARKTDEVRFAETAVFRLASPGWTTDDAIVVLRSDLGKTFTDVELVKTGTPRDAGRVRGAEMGSFALDPRRRVLYFTRSVGAIRSIHAFSIDTALTRMVIQSEPHGFGFSGIRVLDNGRLLFSLQAQNFDILSNEFGK